MQIEERKKRRFVRGMHLFHDISITIASFISSYFIKKYALPNPYAGLSITPNYYIILLLIIIIWFSAFVTIDLYSFFVQKKFKQVILDVLKSITTGIIILITLLYLLNIIDEISRIMLFIFYTINLVSLVIGKKIIYTLMMKFGESEHNIYNVLIIGSKQRAEGAIGLINSSDKGYNIIGCLDIDKSHIGKGVKDGVKVIGTMNDLKSIIMNYVVDEVLFAMPLKDIDSVNVYMLLIEVAGIKVRIFPDWHIYSVIYQPGIASMHFDDFHGLPTMILSATSSKHRDLLLKTILDFTISGSAILVLSPIMILISLSIFLFSGSGIFFKQSRVGLNGRKFTVYKFRTMVKNAEERLSELQTQNEADGPAFKIKNDPRIIPFIGTFLRKTGLDELPQLINVIQGKMSIVGPRPPLPSEVEQYDVWQRRRLSMKPGITCLWQVAPNRNDLSFHKWMELDLEYIDHWSLELDLKIIRKTFSTVFGGHGR